MDSEYFKVQLQSFRRNKFLFEFCLLKIDEYLLCSYDDKFFGSWHIELSQKRIIYEGKDQCLTIQRKIDMNWADSTVLFVNDLSESNIINLIDNLLE